MKTDWLASSLVCEGRVIRPSMDPGKLVSDDLADICLRMHLILDTIEFGRCEGRLINLDVFEAIDTLFSNLLYKDTNHLRDWQDCIERFGDYYQLAGKRTIEVSARAVTHHFHMFDQLRIEHMNE
jgi:hypothetical protein